MNPDEIVVEALVHELLDDLHTDYEHRLLARADLTDSQRIALARLVRQAIADTASTILGTLDGVLFPGGLSADLVVRYGDDAIQGSLQDLFVERAEARGVYA